MTIKYNVTGAKRKELVELIENFTGCKSVYKGAPSFAYEVDYFTIDKDGALSFDDSADSEVIERLIEMLYNNSFEAEELPTSDDEVNTVIQIPMAEFTEASLKNLFSLVENKGSLIKKALGIDYLPINLEDEVLSFPWVAEGTTPEDLKAYMHFITALCNLAKKQKRINSGAKEAENEKYAFRCFLLRLGFIGDEFKTERKTLLRNLEGSSAFKNGKEVG